MPRAQGFRFFLLIALVGLAALTALYLSRDWQPPVLRKVDFKDRVMKGENQTITIVVDEKDPAPAASLTLAGMRGREPLNGTTLSIPMTADFGNGTVVYSLSFNPSYVSSSEGLLDGMPRPNLRVKDKSGNEAMASVRFLANLEAPQVSDLRIERVALGEYMVSAEINDESSFSAYVELPNGTQIQMAKTDGRYSAGVSTLSDLDFVLKAVDDCNMTSSFFGGIKIPDRDKFEMWLPADFTKELSLGLFDYSLIVRGLFSDKKFDILTAALEAAQRNGSSIFEGRTREGP